MSARKRRIAIPAFDLPLDRSDAWERIQGGEYLECGECDALVASTRALRDLEHAERLLGEHFLVCPGRAPEGGGS